MLLYRTLVKTEQRTLETPNSRKIITSTATTHSQRFFPLASLVLEL